MNVTLRAVRLSLGMSQDEMAKALRTAGAESVSKRAVQRWESGNVTAPQPRQARALELVTGLPITLLGFGMAEARVTSDGQGGHDVQPLVMPQGKATFPSHSGIWLSRYEYYSSGREETLTGLHYVLLLQSGNRLSVRSLPGSSDSPLSMDLSVEGNVVTGTWVEQTAKESYYKGARYHGAIQLLVDPSARKMTGKWVGFGSQQEINSGPWELVFQDAGTDQRTIASYDRKPEL